MYAVIKLAVEEAIKSSEAIVASFESFERAKEYWEEELALMREDTENYKDAEFYVSEKNFEAVFEYEDFASKLQLVELRDGSVNVVSF